VTAISSVRPERFLAPVGGSVLLVLAWFAVAHESGSGWVQALGTLVAAVLFVGIVFPAFAVRRVQVAVTRAPRDATVGSPVEISLALNRPARLTPVDPPGAAAVASHDAWEVGPSGSGGRRGTVHLQTVPTRRGVVESLQVRVASASPFGILWWTRLVRIPLPEPLLVAPRLGRPLADPLSTSPLSSSGGRPLPAASGQPRSTRAYRHGDSIRRVHWPATAHSGELMVRESEEPNRAPLVIRVDLPSDPAAADELAEQVLGTVDRLLRRDVPVGLRTTEADGRVVEQTVESRVAAGRRLARAVGREAATR
jgi:uncharacterized protein (DUF58 family)